MKDSFQVVHGLLLTEKGTRLSAEENKYIFKVHPSANKVEVKQAIEELFPVHVTKVNTMNRQGKKKRERTQSYGKTAAWKRAVVTLKDGESIDLT